MKECRMCTHDVITMSIHFSRAARTLAGRDLSSRTIEITDIANQDLL